MKPLHHENNDYTATNAKLTSDNTNCLLKVVGLEAGYSKNKPVISDLSLQIMPGEVIGIIGPNGAGKSTTIKAILGLIEQFKGEIILPPPLLSCPKCGYICLVTDSFWNTGI